MKLLDLDPRWVTNDIFIFKNPTGGKYYLSCKRVNLHSCDQIDLVRAKYPDLDELNIVPCKQESCWEFAGNDFATMTVTPSLDASASGNWHGFITNGEIV